ncbi:MAG TPA: hypothetical protein VGA29_00145 [Ignavibacteriaceae bacterium]|jgi:hypothetical protein
MALNDDELRYKNVIDALKGLKEVKAPKNFEADLMRRINSEKFEEKRQSFWEKIFLPSRLVPSAGLAVAAVLLLFVININSDEVENPLLMEPKVREDMIEAKDVSDIPMTVKEEIPGETRLGSADSNLAEFRDEISISRSRERSKTNSFAATGFAIDKEGLNFRQVNLSEEEKQRLNELKHHFKMLLKNSENN